MLRSRGPGNGINWVISVYALSSEDEGKGSVCCDLVGLGNAYISLIDKRPKFTGLIAPIFNLSCMYIFVALTIFNTLYV